MSVRLKLVRLSICPCGDTVLLDQIKLGTEYLVDVGTRKPDFLYVCGKCGRSQRVEVMQASSISDENYRHWLPVALFGLDDDTGDRG